MSSRSSVTLPYEANDTDHLRAAQRRMQTKRWLADREQGLRLQTSPSLVPDAADSAGSRNRQERTGAR